MLQCIVNSFLHRLLSILIRITWDIFNIEKCLTFQFLLHFSSELLNCILVKIVGKYIYFCQPGVCLGLWCLNKHKHPLMSQVIDQVWRKVVGCSNWPVMRVPQFKALRRNENPGKEYPEVWHAVMAYFQDWLDFGHSLLIFFILAAFWLYERGQIGGFWAFSGEHMWGMAWNLTCRCILTSFRIG